MRLRGLATILAAFILAGCGIFGNKTPAPLPTVVLGDGNATPQATSQPRTGGVTASGVVAPAQEAQLAYTLGGNAKAVNVAVGDRVKAGQVLVSLAGAEKLAAAVEAAKLELLSAQQAVSDLNDGAGQARAAAQLRLATAQKALDTAKKHSQWSQYQVGNKNQIDTARANLVVAMDALRQAEDDFNKVAYRSDSDVGKAAALRRLAAARSTRDTAQYNLNYLLSLPDNFEVTRLDAELAVAQAELDAAQSEVDRLKNGPDPASLGPGPGSRR